MISKELMEELKDMYIEEFDGFAGKTIKGTGRTWDGDYGYLIFDDNKFTILGTEDYYGSKEFGVKSFSDIQSDLNDGNNYLLKEIADFTDFDYVVFNKKLEEAEKVKQELQSKKEKERRYAEYLRLKQEFDK